MEKFKCFEEFPSEALQNVIGGTDRRNFSLTLSKENCIDKNEMYASKDSDSDSETTML